MHDLSLGEKGEKREKRGGSGYHAGYGEGVLPLPLPLPLLLRPLPASASGEGVPDNDAVVRPSLVEQRGRMAAVGIIAVQHATLLRGAGAVVLVVQRCSGTASLLA